MTYELRNKRTYESVHAEANEVNHERLLSPVSGHLVTKEDSLFPCSLLKISPALVKPATRAEM